jgi:hypothetical protein
MAVESGAACVGADDNAAIERMPSRGAVVSVEMVCAFTYHNTVRPRLSLTEFHAFS